MAVPEQLVHGGSPADRAMHLWQLQLPADLVVGKHTAEVASTDVHGRRYTETLASEVTEQRQPSGRCRRPPGSAGRGAGTVAPQVRTVLRAHDLFTGHGAFTRCSLHRRRILTGHWCSGVAPIFRPRPAAGPILQGET